MTSESSTRSLNPLVAVLLSILGPGLGYTYVGRIRLGLAVVVVIIFMLAGAGWSRAVLTPVALYVAAFIGVVVAVVPPIHSAIIAAKTSDAKVEPYNRWWVYAVWILSAQILLEVYLVSRGTVFGFDAHRVPSASMAPTLIKGDYVIVDTWIFDEGPPEFGDLVVFRSPQHPGARFVKRIAGLPGETVEIRRDVLYRNGKPIDEAYIQLATRQITPMSEFAPTVVPEGSYFVLGDNRHNSSDSRFLGPIEADDILGRVELRYFSFDSEIRWDRFPDKFD